MDSITNDHAVPLDFVLTEIATVNPRNICNFFIWMQDS